MSLDHVSRPGLEQYRRQARDLKKALAAGEPAALERLRAHHPRADAVLSPAARTPRLADALLVVARENGFPSWTRLKRHLELAAGRAERLAAFADAALPPREDHRAGGLERARELLAADPDLARDELCAACLTGDADSVERFLAADPAAARRPTGPREWEPLLYLCFSRFLRLDPSREAGFLRAAEALLRAGADPNACWVAREVWGEVKEAALYGALGVAGCLPLGRMLLEAGADPDDEETAYHAAEFPGVPAAELLVRHNLGPVGRAALVVRKLDYDDLEGIRRVLALGLDPNAQGIWGVSGLHQAIRRGRSLPFIRLLLEHGADPNGRTAQGQTAVSMAAAAGRRDVMEVLLEAGARDDLTPEERYLYACASGDATGARDARAQQPDLADSIPEAARVAALGTAAREGRLESLRLMLAEGFPLNAQGEEAFAALHHACWWGRAEAARVLLEAGADPYLRNIYGGTALGTALHGAENSLRYGSPEGRDHAAVVALLLEAGMASLLPAGAASAHPGVDAVLARYR